MRIRIFSHLAAAIALTALTIPGGLLAQESDDAAVEETRVDTPRPSTRPDAGPFSKGRIRVGFYGGLGRTYGQDYFILGGGAGYYLADGLEVGADVEGWLLQSPSIWKITPQVRYVLWQAGAIKPYLGAFWRQTYVGSPFDDFSSYGGRAGVAYRNGGNYLAAGIVYERYNDCSIGDCDTTYPEVAFWISF